MKTEFPGEFERHLKFYFSIVNILAAEKSRRADFFEKLSFENNFQFFRWRITEKYLKGICVNSKKKAIFHVDAF